MELDWPEADWRTRNAGRLLFAATDLFVRDKVRAMRDDGVPGVSNAIMALMLNMDANGARLTELAVRAGQTKQSMIELVDRAEALGIAERRADPDDLRAKTIHFTREGLGMLGKLEHAIGLAERRFAAATGEPFLRDLQDCLGRYVGLPDDEPHVMRATPARRRERNAGRLLSLAARRFARDLLMFVHQRGHRDVPHVLLALFRNLDLTGTRLTSLAARARMTRPSMRELIDRAEALGLVERRPDPTDRRAKLVWFTPSGLDMMDEVRRGVACAEDEFERVVGKRFARALRDRLIDYIRSEAE